MVHLSVAEEGSWGRPSFSPAISCRRLQCTPVYPISPQAASSADSALVCGRGGQLGQAIIPKRQARSQVLHNLIRRLPACLHLQKQQLSLGVHLLYTMQSSTVQAGQATSAPRYGPSELDLQLAKIACKLRVL